MAYTPARKHLSRKTIILIAVSAVMIGLAVFTTAKLLRELNIPRDQATTTPSAQTSQAPESLKTTADKQLQEGKLQDALASYKLALAGYQTAKNDAAASDVSAQITLVEKSLDAANAKTAKPAVGAASGTSAPTAPKN